LCESTDLPQNAAMTETTVHNRQKNPVTRDHFDAVLFDLDGVLTSTAAIHADAGRQCSTRSWRPRGERLFDIDTDYKKYVDGRPRYEGVRTFLESRGIELPLGESSEEPNNRTISGLGNKKDAMVKQAIAEGRVQPFEGSLRWIDQLRRDSFKLGVVSSSRNAGPVLKAAKMDHLFSVRVDGATLGEENIKGKPAPDSFLKAAQRLGATPRRTVVVEDALSGVEAGRAGNFGLVIGVDREGAGPTATPFEGTGRISWSPIWVNSSAATKNRNDPTRSRPPPGIHLPHRRLALGGAAVRAGVHRHQRDHLRHRQRLLWHARRVPGGPPALPAWHVHQRLLRNLADSVRREGVRLRQDRPDDDQRAGRKNHPPVRRR
jgi:beta-phosphoglucomutase family hydrolase